MTAFSQVVERLGGDFPTEAFGRTYRIWRGVGNFSSILTWDDLNTVIGRGRLEPPRLRLHRDGELIPPQRYATTVTTRRNVLWQRIQPARLHGQLHDGASLVLDAVDELHQPAERLAQALEGVLRGRVQINVYASWTPTEGFGTHWDDHDVIVVQLEGAKRWRLYGPTRINPLHRDTEAPEPPADEPLEEVVLRAGDMLYLPRGWWHAVATTEGRSLHLTCGLQTTTGVDLLGWLSDRLRTSETVRAQLPVFAPPQEQAAYLELLRNEVTDALHEGAIADFLSARDGIESGRPMPSLPFLDAVPAREDLHVRLTTARAQLTDNDQGQVMLVAGGEEWTFAPSVRAVLSPLLDGSSALLGHLADASGLTVGQVAGLITELVNANVAAVSEP
ncbi:cupin-like domain-containing protein [Streptomyces sp. ISL-22]|uniref:cupin domain-containing protein n=1 Tax=unclassified Streptomyces TaxID=2593676 RepID=UPI001BE87F85|nr:MULTISPECIES: cupin domain-containing protein [unclassified Streptomyces]MBT2418593.1 cupin-like domain-containing protein [Streptomyces sp. ISL-24]MBT2434304.1 cupin-like domain-containing protein [Streptomyces sp. ISL-22]